MNRPRAVDFLEEDEKEVETKNFSDEEPLIIERNENGESLIEGDNVSEAEEAEEVKNVDTLPSGAISKGKKKQL